MNEKPSSRNDFHTVIFDQLFPPKTAGHRNYNIVALTTAQYDLTYVQCV